MNNTNNMIAETDDVVAFIYNNIRILASVGEVDMESREYVVYVTSKYEFSGASITLDRVMFNDVVSIYKKVN
jgi:hypothetical protein